MTKNEFDIKMDDLILSAPTRVECDFLGEREVQSYSYYGIHTLRAKENFQITGKSLSSFRSLIKSLAMVKQAAAEANFELELIGEDKFKAITSACFDVADGLFDSEFIVDPIQGGAGTSTNMNANEVIANRALDYIGKSRGEYDYIHPLNDVNMSQSTNDVYPTSLRLATIFESEKLIISLKDIVCTLKAKGDEFKDVIKIGRTQLQDAVPMTLGQEFSGFAENIYEDILRLNDVIKLLHEVNLGATAIGTQVNAHPRYPDLAIEKLSAISGFKMIRANNYIEATSDTGVFITFSSVLKRIAVKISKICNDLRLLSSGPSAGINEINLPAVQAGSSIMPGKVNPVIPEVVNQVSFKIVGNDIAITMACEAGQLQLNAMEPVIADCIFESINMLNNAITTLNNNCIKGISANTDRCRELLLKSPGLATLLSPYIGYDKSASIAKKCVSLGIPVSELILADGTLTKEQMQEVLRKISN